MTTTQQELEFKEGERYYIKVELLGEKPVVYTGAEYQRRFKGKYIFLSPEDVERTGGVENSIELLLAEERFFQR